MILALEGQNSFQWKPCWKKNGTKFALWLQRLQSLGARKVNLVEDVIAFWVWCQLICKGLEDVLWETREIRHDVFRRWVSGFKLQSYPHQFEIVFFFLDIILLSNHVGFLEAKSGGGKKENFAGFQKTTQGCEFVAYSPKVRLPPKCIYFPRKMRLPPKCVSREKCTMFACAHSIDWKIAEIGEDKKIAFSSCPLMSDESSLAFSEERNPCVWVLSWVGFLLDGVLTSQFELWVELLSLSFGLSWELVCRVNVTKFSDFRTFSFFFTNRKA